MPDTFFNFYGNDEMSFSCSGLGTKVDRLNFSYGKPSQLDQRRFGQIIDRIKFDGEIILWRIVSLKQEQPNKKDYSSNNKNTHGRIAATPLVKQFTLLHTRSSYGKCDALPVLFHPGMGMLNNLFRAAQVNEFTFD